MAAVQKKAGDVGAGPLMVNGDRRGGRRQVEVPKTILASPGRPTEIVLNSRSSRRCPGAPRGRSRRASPSRRRWRGGPPGRLRVVKRRLVPPAPSPANIRSEILPLRLKGTPRCRETPPGKFPDSSSAESPPARAAAAPPGDDLVERTGRSGTFNASPGPRRRTRRPVALRLPRHTVQDPQPSGPAPPGAVPAAPPAPATRLHQGRRPPSPLQPWRCGLCSPTGPLKSAPCPRSPQVAFAGPGDESAILLRLLAPMPKWSARASP